MMQAARRKLENERSQQRGPMHSARVDRGLVSAPHAQRESGVLAVATAHDIGEDPLPTDPTGPGSRRIELVGRSRSPRPGAEGAVSVTLCIFGWQNVQPGTLSWVFPSLDAAIRAAEAMRNATEWLVIEGPIPASEIEWARRRGTILAKHSPRTGLASR